MTSFTLKKLPLAILAILATPSISYADDSTTQLDVVPVTATIEAAQTETTPVSELLQNGNSETGTALRNINGVDASRMGGHGVDLVINGQKSSQLNILMDGAKIEGGCPNRMDPPTAYAEMSSFDEVTVIQGVNSVQYGAGGSGGTVLFERNAPTFEEGKPYQGEINLGTASSGLTQDINATVAAGGDKGYIVLQGSKKSADNYKDGNGDEVRSSYQSKQGHVEVGFRPTEDQLLKLSYEQSIIEDALFEGAGMDSPESDGRTLRLGYEAKNIAKNIQTLEIDLYRSEVDHIMDNFTFRPETLVNKQMESPTNVETKGAKIKLTSQFGHTTLDYGVQFESIAKYAELNSLAMPAMNQISWPDTLQETRSVFAESTSYFKDSQKVILGLRYDAVEHGIGLTTDAVPAYTLAYTDYNGKTKVSDANLNGLVRYERSFGNKNAYIALSRTHRYPDATELFMAKNTPVDKWIGNPDLDPEQHNQLDIGISENSKNTTWSVNAYYDNVNNYILRDLSQNQAISGLTDANVYANIDAIIYGLNSSFSHKLNRNLTMGGRASFTTGENTTDNRNLSNIAPLSGTLYSEYSASNWMAGTRFNFATAQTEVNAEYEELETAAWSTLDLYGHYKINKTITLSAGVDNVFDHAYQTYLNRVDSYSGDTFKVYEPGRIAWVKLNAKF
jgi:iron complex outermembrane receptor protein